MPPHPRPHPAAGQGNRLPLDNHGTLARLRCPIGGLALIIGVAAA